MSDRALRQGPVSAPMRMAISLTLAILAAHYGFVSSQSESHRDFAQLWYAARTLLSGGDPYGLMGPGGAFDWMWPFYYPLPAAVAALPIAPFPEAVAMSIVAFVSVGALAWALASRGYAPLLGMFSWSTIHAVVLLQWSPLLASALVITPIAALLVVKPTIGAAIFAARPSWWAIGGALILTIAAFVIDPSWPARWRDALNSPNIAPGYDAGHFAVVQFAGGGLALLALARWRRSEARLLAVLACVPQTLLPYETVPLLFIPRGWTESIALLILSYITPLWVSSGGPYADFATRTPAYGLPTAIAMYLPATLMVLRRPNEGTLPAWLERGAMRLPPWIRGAAGRG